MCPMTPCGARQMSMFSRQLFKAIQSVSPWQMNDNVTFVLLSPGYKIKDCYPLSAIYRGCHGRGGEESFSVSERTDGVVFSHALLLVKTPVYVRIPMYPPHI